MEEHSIAQRLGAEFIGTALLVFIGAGSVPAILLLESGSKAPFSGADLGFIAIAFGLIVTAMVYAIGKVSGCHINPAVTFALAATKRFPWGEVPLYWVSQVAGGIAGGLAIWASFGQRAIDLGSGFGVVDFNGAVTSWFSRSILTRSGWASPRPASDSGTMSSGLFRNFLTVCCSVALTFPPSGLRPARGRSYRRGRAR
jgi:glycerol uptake facilitator protein